MPGAHFRVGGWYRFQGIGGGSLAYIHSEVGEKNAVWIPRGDACTITVNKIRPSLNADEVPEDQVSDEMWRELGRWGLTGETNT